MIARGLLAVAVAYVAGSIPFGLLLVWLRRGEDLRSAGSGNIGATNALRIGGVLLGSLTLTLDVAKGTFGYWLGLALLGHPVAPTSTLSMAMLLAPVVGHVFPIWLRFRGGKGVATALGVMLAVDGWLALWALIAFLVVVLLTRIVSAGSLAAALIAPVVSAVRYGATPMTAGVLGVAVLIVVRHQENIRRMIAGTERRVGARGPRA